MAGSGPSARSAARHPSASTVGGDLSARSARLAKACKGLKDVGVAVLPDSVFIGDAADSAVEHTSVFVAIS